MRKSWTILVDSREKKALSFPSHLVMWNPSTGVVDGAACTVRLETRVVTHETADYQLEGFPSHCIVERKNSLTELATNLCTPQGRRKFTAELGRLQTSCRYPYIFLEGDPHTLRSTKSLQGREGINPHIVRDILMRACLDYGVQLLILPCSTPNQRGAAAEWIASLLIAGATACPPPSAPHSLVPSSTTVPLTQGCPVPDAPPSSL